MTDARLEDLLDHLGVHLDTVTFPKGHRIFREGEAADACYLVQSGEVRVEVESQEVDTDAVLSFMTAPAVLGEVGLLAVLPRSATAVAETAVAARRLSHAA